MNIDLGKNVFQQIPDVANRFKNRVTEGVRDSEAAKNVVSKFLASKALNIFGGQVTTSQLLARGSGAVSYTHLTLPTKA